MNKKLFIFLSIFITAAITANAQFYFHAGAGYSAPTQKQEVYSYGRFIPGLPVLIKNGLNDTYENFETSFNQGLHLRLGAGYSFTDLLGLELTLDRVKSKEVTAREEFGNNIHTFGLRGEMVSVTLSPVLNFKLNDSKFSVFLKPGVVIGISEIDEDYRYNINNVLTITSTNMEGGVSAGLHLSTGLTYSLSNKFSLYGELMSVTMQYNPKFSTVKRHQVGDVYALDDLPVTKFMLSDDYKFPVVNIKPRKSYSFSGIQFNLGVKISPWAKEGKARMRSSDNPFQH